MVEILWIVGVVAAAFAFHQFVKGRDLQLTGGGDPVGWLESIARDEGAAFFANETRSVATVYFAPPDVANVRMTKDGACTVAIPLVCPPPFTGVVEPVQHEGAPRLALPRRGLLALEAMDPGWSAHFEIFADNLARAREGLTPDVVARFLLLKQHGFIPRVVVNRTSVRIETRGLWEGTSDVSRFIAFARFVVDAFSLRVEAIQFQDDGGSVRAVCCVCGMPLGDAATVACAHCETPHHDDCWAYNSGCALFGCAGGPSAPIARHPPI